MTAQAVSTGASRVRPGSGGIAERVPSRAAQAARAAVDEGAGDRLCAGPVAFGAVLSQQSGVPGDTLLGIWVHSSGYALSFVVLGFAGYLGFPVLAGVLAGDMFSSEDRYETWKTVLTRSRTRRDVFAGKILAATTFSVALVALLAISSLLSGLLFTGDQPFVGFGGTLIPSGEALLVLLASWVLSILPVLAFVSMAVLFSVATRSGIAGVLGPLLVALAMQLLAFIGSGAWVHMLLLASAFDDWHGLLATPAFYGPLIVGSVVSCAWAAACLGVSWLLLSRRDFAGPPVSRRPGWVVPVRAAAAFAVLLLVLVAASSLGPAGVTRGRLEASIGPAFNSLTALQQQELGRPIPRAAKLENVTACRRRSGTSTGPGDDWVCTVTVFASVPGADPFQTTSVTYDVSVKSNGCYKADAPPSFVGQQTMSTPHGHSAVNPLFTIYGCFDTTAPAGVPGIGKLLGERSTPDHRQRIRPERGSSSPSGSSHLGWTKKSLEELHAAERAAGPRVTARNQRIAQEGRTGIPGRRRG